MPDGGFTADLEQLRQHAKTVTDIAGQAEEAADAADQVADMDNAYGLLCRPIAWILKPPQDETAKCIQACADALRATAQKLTDSANLYKEMEDWIGQGMEEILDDLDSIGRRGVLTERDGTIRGR